MINKKGFSTHRFIRILILFHFHSDESIEKYWKAELDLTFSCLPANPKSYGTWHHRCWTMLKIPDPNWEKGKQF